MTKNLFKILKSSNLLVLLVVLIGTVGEFLIFKYTGMPNYVMWFQLFLLSSVKLLGIFVVARFYGKHINIKRYIVAILPFVALFVIVGLLNTFLGNELILRTIALIFVVLIHLFSYVYSIRGYGAKNSIRATLLIIREGFVSLITMYGALVILGMGLFILIQVIFILLYSSLPILASLLPTMINIVIVILVFGETYALGVLYFEKFENILNGNEE